MDGLDKSTHNESTDSNGQSGIGGDVRRLPTSGVRREVLISGGVSPGTSGGVSPGTSPGNKAGNPSHKNLGVRSSGSGLPRLGDVSPHRVPEHISSSFQRPRQPSRPTVRPLGAGGKARASGSSALADSDNTVDSSSNFGVLAGKTDAEGKVVAEEMVGGDATVSVTDVALDRASGKISGLLQKGKGQDSGEITADPNFGDVPMSTFPVGMKIDERYEIVSVLGVGGFATVYRAHHLTIDRDVALKVMDLKKGVDPSYSGRFFREAKIAAKIHHNNVVSIYDFGHVAETGQPYIAMEMLHGHDLSHEISKNGPLSPNRAFVLFRPVLDALSEGHRLGIVHKDLKPENLYLVDPGGPRELMKILDFGVARINSSEVAKLTSAGQLLGTPRYLAPEYITSQNVSPAIDVYQMALILSEALTGIPAVSGDPFHAMMLHCSGQIQISDFLLNGPVGEVFRKAIAIEPTERYENCAAFGEALDTVADYFLSHTPLKGGAPQHTPEAPVTGRILPSIVGFKATGIYTEPEFSNQEAKARKSNTLRNVFLVLLVLVCALVVAYIVFAGGRKQPPPVEQPLVVETVDPKRQFQFNSEPTGALVTRNTRTICQTPCSAEFKLSELRDEYKPLIVFKLDGYEDKNLEITEELYASSQGRVDVELEKVVAKELPFKLDYIPENATVVESDSGKIVCKLSPCTYIFSIDQVAVTLTFSAPGYLDKNVALTASDFTEDPISVELEKRPAAPVVRRSRPSKSHAPANTPPAAVEAKPAQEEEKAAKPQPTIKTMF